MSKEGEKKLDEVLERLTGVEESVDTVATKQEEILSRLDRAENVIDPVMKISKSAKEKLIDGAGWIVIFLMGALGMIVLQVFRLVDISSFIK